MNPWGWPDGRATGKTFQQNLGRSAEGQANPNFLLESGRHFWFPLQSHPPGQNTKGHN